MEILMLIRCAALALVLFVVLSLNGCTGDVEKVATDEISTTFLASTTQTWASREQQEQVEGLFNTLDTNGDGTLSFDEASSFITETAQNQLGKDPTADELQQVFNGIDRNTDSEISQAEMIAFLISVSTVTTTSLTTATATITTETTTSEVSTSASFSSTGTASGTSASGTTSESASETTSVTATTWAPDTTPLHEEIMRDAFWFFYDEMRDPDTGLYCDKVNLYNVGVCSKEWASSDANPLGYSTATIGWGFVILCIGLELGYLTDWDAVAEEVITAIGYLNVNWERGDGQFLRHWGRPDYTDPDYKAKPFTSVGEVSTIDSAIAALGAIFIGNYFSAKTGNSTVADVANDFVQSVDWAFAVTSTGVLLDPERPTVIAKAFNEYYMLAYLAHKTAGDTNSFVNTSWYTNWVPIDDNTKPTGAFAPIPFLIDDGNRSVGLYGGYNIMSSFVPQFPGFVCKEFASHPFWKKIVGDYLLGDMSWWKWNLHAGETAPDVFGSGPGQSSDNFYAVDKIEKANPTKTFSAAIMAGYFIAETSTLEPDMAPYHAQIHAWLDALWNSETYKGAPMTTHQGRKILWRSSTTNANWKPNLIVMDFANFPLGYALNFVGRDFYMKYAL